MRTCKEGLSGRHAAVKHHHGNLYVSVRSRQCIPCVILIDSRQLHQHGFAAFLKLFIRSSEASSFRIWHRHHLDLGTSRLPPRFPSGRMNGFHPRL